MTIAQRGSETERTKFILSTCTKTNGSSFVIAIQAKQCIGKRNKAKRRKVKKRKIRLFWMVWGYMYFRKTLFSFLSLFFLFSLDEWNMNKSHANHFNIHKNQQSRFCRVVACWMKFTFCPWRTPFDVQSFVQTYFCTPPNEKPGGFSRISYRTHSHHPRAPRINPKIHGWPRYENKNGCQTKQQQQKPTKKRRMTWNCKNRK